MRISKPFFGAVLAASAMSLAPTAPAQAQSSGDMQCTPPGFLGFLPISFSPFFNGLFGGDPSACSPVEPS